MSVAYSCTSLLNLVSAVSAEREVQGRHGRGRFEELHF